MVKFFNIVNTVMKFDEFTYLSLVTETELSQEFQLLIKSFLLEGSPRSGSYFGEVRTHSASPIRSHGSESTKSTYKKNHDFKKQHCNEMKKPEEN